MEVLARYCSIPGYNKLCCESCSKRSSTLAPYLSEATEEVRFGSALPSWLLDPSSNTTGGHSAGSHRLKMADTSVSLGKDAPASKTGPPTGSNKTSRRVTPQAGRGGVNSSTTAAKDVMPRRRGGTTVSPPAGPTPPGVDVSQESRWPSEVER